MQFIKILCRIACVCSALLYFNPGLSQVTIISLGAVSDAEVGTNTPDDPIGLNQTLGIAKTSISVFNIYARSLVKFDLSELPSNAIIVSASLRFNVLSGPSAEVAIEKVIENWSESTVTWNNKPQVSSINAVIESPTISYQLPYQNHDYVSAGLKTMVQEWINYPSRNYGVTLRLNNETVSNSISYSSREAGSTTYPLPGGGTGFRTFIPQLIIQYVLPVTIALNKVTHCATTASTDGAITVNAANGSGTYSYQWFNSAGTAIGNNSPAISGLKYGWYGLKVTDGLGNYNYTSFLVGVECETVNISYVPGPNYTDDALLNDLVNFQTIVDYRDVNYGNALTSYTERRRQGLPLAIYSFRSLTRFRLVTDRDLSFDKALLILKGTGHDQQGRPNDAELLRATSGWTESLVTYNTMPATTATGKILLPATTSVNQNESIDLRSFWNLWKNNPAQNQGFLLQLQDHIATAYTLRQYHSSDAVSSANWPGMEFEVSLKCMEPVSLKAKKDGSVFFLQRPVLKFHFDEMKDAGTGEYVKFEIRDQLNHVIASCDHAGNVTGVPNGVIHDQGGNFHQLDLSALNINTNDYYTLTVYTITGKQLYLSFIKPN